MMADVSGFSRMMGADEEATVDQIKEFHRHVKTLVALAVIILADDYEHGKVHVLHFIAHLFGG